ncbi:hypothetical protein K438DRAFT_2045780 [Mycena galopus ATCC 62051]|nr:hypothetical protein K438DRAFT_2045780 [Mycena galopus ATCC 62051]
MTLTTITPTPTYLDTEIDTMFANPGILLKEGTQLVTSLPMMNKLCGEHFAIGRLVQLGLLKNCKDRARSEYHIGNESNLGILDPNLIMHAALPADTTLDREEADGLQKLHTHKARREHTFLVEVDARTRYPSPQNTVTMQSAVPPPVKTTKSREKGGLRGGDSEEQRRKGYILGRMSRPANQSRRKARSQAIEAGNRTDIDAGADAQKISRKWKSNSQTRKKKQKISRGRRGAVCAAKMKFGWKPR